MLDFWQVVLKNYSEMNLIIVTHFMIFYFQKDENMPRGQLGRLPKLESIGKASRLVAI